MQKKNVPSINVNDNKVREQEVFISNTYKQVEVLKENIINSNSTIKFLRDRLEKFNIKVPRSLDVISEEVINVATETNFVNRDNLIENLEQIAKNATFELNSLKDIIKMQEDKIQKLQDILIEDFSKKIEQNSKTIEQNNQKIEMLASKLKKLNVQLPNDLTEKSEIPVSKPNNSSIGKFDIQELDNILKQKLEQIDKLEKIIKEQDSQIKQLINKKLPAVIQHKNIEIEHFNKTVKDNNKKIEMLASKLKKLNVKLSSDLTKKSEIPAPKFGDYSPKTILKLRSDQINNLKKKKKKQDNQIKQLSAELDSIKSNLVEQAKEKYSQLTSLNQIVEKNMKKIIEKLSSLLIYLRVINIWNCQKI